MKRFIYLLFTTLITIGVQAQSVKVSAPKQVAVGEEFQVDYTVYTDDVDGIRLGNLPNGIERLYGPMISSQSSFQMYNGHTSSSSSTKFTYFFVATKKGNFTLPVARVMIEGQVVSSNVAKVAVYGNADKYTQQAPSNPNVAAPVYSNKPNANSNNTNDLFISVSTNKKSVYENEPILLTYKVYTAVNLISLNGKMPDLTGFHMHEITQSQQATFTIENINGRRYKCATWSQYILYPQMTGKLNIPSITFRGILDSYSADQYRDIVADGVTIDVKPLPAKPKGFTSAVGQYNITAHLDKKEVAAGDPINLRLIVSGVGNLKLIKKPEVLFPNDFDVYDTKISDKSKLSANGVEGSMVYDYIAVPRKEGVFTIPAVEFVYFDLSTNSYKTLKTNSFKVNVLKGTANPQALDKIACKDTICIRDIVKGVNVEDGINKFFMSWFYWLTLIIVLAMFGIVFYMLRQRSVMRSDLVFLKLKNAKKVANTKMYNAQQLMLKGRSADFYDEVLHALWGYISNKLNIPVEQLSRENISEQLRNKAVEEETVQAFISAIDECEFERYAPGDEKGNMKLTYDKAVHAITSVEETMSKKKEGKRRIFLWLMLLLCSLSAAPLSAQHKELAEEAYRKGNYEQAIRMYENALKINKNASLYFHLGNAYYKNNNITKSIIAYERALRLSPSNSDILFNLRLAHTKTIDRTSSKPEMFFVTIYRAVVRMLTIDGWAYLSIAMLILCLGCVLVYFFSDKLHWRKVGFGLAILLGICFVFCTVNAAKQKNAIDNTDCAIIVAPVVHIRLAPEKTANEVAVLHEGTKLKIKNRAVKGWFEVKLPNHKVGWIKSDKVEEI